jgi:hypothetical protein
MKPRAGLPRRVYAGAHARFPRECGLAGVYMTAFFGHRLPDGRRSPESIWRGVLRAELRTYCEEKTGRAGQ